MTSHSAGVEIDRYDSLQQEPLSHLLQLLWSPDADLNARHLEWKYERNPYAGSCIYVARESGRLVAMRGFFGARYFTGDGAIMPGVMCAGDLVIAPEYRGRGVFTRIMTRALEDFAGGDVEFLLNFSADASVRLGSLAAGWGSTAPVARFRRSDAAETSRRSMPPIVRERAVSFVRSVERSQTVAGSLVRRFTRWAPFAALDRMAKLDSSVTVAARSRPEEMANLIRRVEKDGRIRHVRDETYFRWRFGSPLSDYRFFFLGTETIDAYLVMRARHYPMRGKAIRIGDWVGVNGEARAAVMLAVLAALPRGAIEVWASSLTEEDRTLLRANSFVEEDARNAAKYSPAVLSRPVASPIPPRPWLFGGRDILDIDSWNLRLLDSDGC